jgi:hypothetical protein
MSTGVSRDVDFLLPVKAFRICANVCRLCGVGVRVPEAVGLERGPLSLVRIIEELLERKSSGSGLENRN